MATKFSAGHIIPMELVNQILITRPIHPTAKIMKNSIKSVWSVWDHEKKLFYVLDNKIAICVSGNMSIYDGEVCTLHPDDKYELPYADSGIQELEIVLGSYYSYKFNKHI